MPYKNKEDKNRNDAKCTEQHKEAIKQYRAKYIEQHKEAINQYKKQCNLIVQTCECCDITIRRHNFAEHTRSKMHIANSNNDLNSAVN